MAYFLLDEKNTYNRTGTSGILEQPMRHIESYTLTKYCIRFDWIQR